ncbi:MAG TPA: SDR family NAD(P)-dependent oxidoreductase [bacterium]|jgi:NAD(P)-dependent dehydrogenase (short-subunit alcohol dehydrogenase family)
MESFRDILKDKVAVVTGASRGVGKGIACVLGEAGATVSVTGRSTRSKGSTENLAGTVEDTAEEVSKRGGEGIPVLLDHTRDAEVEAFFERVFSEQGKLDLLVNNAWGGYERYDSGGFQSPFWEQPFADRWNGMFISGVRAHLLAARCAAPMMLSQRAGLMISTVAWDEGKYLGNLYYDAAKSALVRMMWGMSRELFPFGVASVALAPGFVRTERVMAAHAEQPFDLRQTESPEYAGRAVAALAADPDYVQQTGKVLYAGDLAKHYEFTDIDGRWVPKFRLPEEYA